MDDLYNRSKYIPILNKLLGSLTSEQFDILLKITGSISAEEAEILADASIADPCFIIIASEIISDTWLEKI